MSLIEKNFLKCKTFILTETAIMDMNDLIDAGFTKHFEEHSLDI